MGDEIADDMRSRVIHNVESAAALEKAKEKAAKENLNVDESSGTNQDLQNRDLEELLDFYDCHDLLPFASHIMWLASVKEAMGYIPFALDYFAIRCLVILQEEVNKKSAKDSMEMKDRTSDMSRGDSVGLDKVVLQGRK